MNDDGYLSRNRPYLAAMQRQRRARMVRVDYMPGKAARDAIEAMRARSRPGSVSATNSAVIDAIVTEWARLTGITQSDLPKTKTPATLPELCDTYARARVTSEAQSAPRVRVTSDFLAKRASARAGETATKLEYPPPSQARTGANNSGSLPVGANQARVICGAKRRRDGQPCQGLSVPGKLRCKWHGGASTGPRTDAGRARSKANLRQYRNRDI